MKAMLFLAAASSLFFSSCVVKESGRGGEGGYRDHRYYRHDHRGPETKVEVKERGGHHHRDEVKVKEKI